jgi:hypothetical protein
VAAVDSLSDAQFHAQTMSDEHGASRQINTLAVPTSGYMVGGAAKTQEKNVPDFKFTHQTVGRHLEALQGRFGVDPSIHQGSWRKGGSVALDASNRVSDKRTAMDTGIKRQEKAIYGIKEGRDINLPKLAKMKIKRPK